MDTNETPNNESRITGIPEVEVSPIRNINGSKPAIDLPKWMISASNWLSAIFSPLLIPTICMAIIMWITPLAFLPEKTRLVSTLIVMCITAGIPFSAIIALIRLGKVNDLAISNRRQRALPLSIAIVCYIAACVYLHYIHSPIWLLLMVAGAAFSCLLAMLISFKWKISAHGTGVGGLLGMMFWIAFNKLFMVNILPWIVASVIIAGLVGTSRLILGHHTPAQIYAGTIMGALVIFASMSITYFYI